MGETDVRDRSHRQHMQAHRERRRQEGFRQTMVWLHQQSAAKIDEAVSTGRFKTQSEAVAAAVQHYFGVKEHG